MYLNEFSAPSRRVLEYLLRNSKTNHKLIPLKNYLKLQTKLNLFLKIKLILNLIIIIINHYKFF